MLETLRDRLKSIEAVIEQSAANLNMLIGRKHELRQTIKDFEAPVVDETKKDEVKDEIKDVDQSPAV